MQHRYKFRSLCRWINDNDGYVNPKIDIEETKYGRSIKSIDRISEDELLFRIPKSILLNLDNISKKTDLEIPSDKLKVVISLLYEVKNEESFWQPYIDILPNMKDMQYHPLILHLSGKYPNISEVVTDNLNCLQSDLSYMIEFITSNKIFEDIHVEEITWAFLIVTTRMWKNFGLVPLADMFQHRNDSKIFLKEIEEDSVGMKSSSKMLPNQDIYDNYNIKDDTQLLTSYGFIDYSTECHLELPFEEDINEKKYLSLLNFEQENLYYYRKQKMSEDDVRSNLYKNPLENKLEIESIDSLINKIKSLRISKDILSVKNSSMLFNKNSIEFQILELMTKIDNLIIQNIKYLEELKFELSKKI